MEFVDAPFGSEPRFGDEKQHRLAARGGLFQSPLPPLAGSNSRLGVEIQEYVSGTAPVGGNEPLLQRDRLRVVLARMTDENARHASTPKTLSAMTIRREN